ncbi:Cyanate hydratase [Balamuthia mandrillaris]
MAFHKCAAFALLLFCLTLAVSAVDPHDFLSGFMGDQQFATTDQLDQQHSYQHHKDPAFGSGLPVHQELSLATITMLEAKSEKKLTWDDLGKSVGQDPMWVASLVYNVASADKDIAGKLMEALGLNDKDHKYVHKQLVRYPYKGSLAHRLQVPSDPLLYRFWEVMQSYAMPLRDIMFERFDDKGVGGIMSAVDFSIQVKQSEEVGDDEHPWVEVVMEGKWLPFEAW